MRDVQQQQSEEDSTVVGQRDSVHRRRNRAVVAVTTVAIVTLLGSACSAKKSADASGAKTGAAAATSSGSSAAPSSSAPATPAAELTVSAATGATNISPVQPIKVSVAGGTLTAVTMTNSDGKTVKGAIGADKASWTSAEPLGYAKSYTVAAVAQNADGVQTKKQSTFSTVKPDNMTMPYIQTAAGGEIKPGVTFGVGQVIRIHFDEAITNRKAAQQAITVKTTPAQIGGFNWLSDRDVYWRSKDYLKAGTAVSITASVYGKNFGSASQSLYGQADTSTSFKVGAKHVSIADDNTKQIYVYENDKLIKTIATSMGRHTSIAGDTGPIDLRTNSGPHVVVGGETNINMNSASFGLSKGANAYKTIVPVGVRISYDGEYVHWADWSVWAQGNTDTSHGCLNVSPDNSWWFYHWSQPGDIVDVRNTGRPLQLWNSGYWTASWAQWSAGSAK